MRAFLERFPCPICAASSKVEISKKQKPYYFCNSCGVQVFIRGQSGIQRFKQISNDEKLLELLNSNSFSKNSEVIYLLSQIRQIEAAISRIEDEEDLFFEDKLIIGQKKILSEKLQKLKFKYLKILGN